MIKSGTMHKQGEICLLPIPFSDLSSSKKRPVLIISNNGYNLKTDDVLVMAITSNIQNNDTSIIINQDNMKTGILKSVSQVRIDKIYSINKELIIKTFGELNMNKFDEITDSLIDFIRGVTPNI